MDTIRVKSSDRVPSKVWLAPADERRQHAVIRTPLGDCTLFRGPGARPTSTAKAEAWERWEFFLDGVSVLEIDDAAMPWQLIRRRMRGGVKGRLGGRSFTATAGRRSPRPSRRGIHFSFEDGRKLSFVVHRLHQRLVRETGQGQVVVSRSRDSGWETAAMDREETALVCFVLVSGIDELLESPLIDVLFPF